MPNLSDEHYQFFIFGELFRGRKSAADLRRKIQETITYKLHLFSNNIYPELARNNEDCKNKIEKRKIKIDKRIQIKLIQILNLFTKGVSHTIYGHTESNSIKTTISWQEPAESTPFLPLVEKKKDSKYYLTGLGEAVLVATSNIAGIELGFSSFLNKLAGCLYKRIKASAKLSLEEIIRFYCLLIGLENVDFQVLPEQSEQKDLDSFVNDSFDVYDQFIEREFGFIIKDYTSFASIQLLGAFEKLMETNAYLFFQRLKSYKKNKKRTWEEKRSEAMLKSAGYEPITVKQTSLKFHLDFQKTKKELENFKAEGLLTSLKIFDNSGSSELKYGTLELFTKFPFLTKTCENCMCYNKRFKTCLLLRLLQAYNPSLVPSDYYNYAKSSIRPEATACKYHKDLADFNSALSKVRFTINIQKLSLKMRKIADSYFLGQTKKTVFHCCSCQEKIEEFGSEEQLFFPRKRVSCPKCSTVYFKKNEESITIQTEHRHFLRMLYYQIAGSIPQVLLEKDPSYAFVIYDNENIKLERKSDKTFVLTICKNEIPLEKVQYIFFSGKRYKRIEKFLLTLAEFEPEKYHYTISRAKTKEKKSKRSLSSESSREKPFTKEQYQFLQTVISYLGEKKTFNQSFLQARHLSNIGGGLYLRKTNLRKEFPNEHINRQLFEMIDLQIKVAGGVRSRYYGMQLEAQSNRFFFELLKDEGAKVGLWTRGRVTSRLVKDMFLSFSRKTSHAYAPLDVILNQFIRGFRSEIDEVFRKIGLEPALMGAGLFHKRRTKSDIDNLGLYFDLIEPVRVLALITMFEAMQAGVLTIDDCSLVLGQKGQEVYRIKNNAQKKIKQLITAAVSLPVYYHGKTIPFLQAFEHYLAIFRKAFISYFEEFRLEKQLSTRKIKQCFQEANFNPFVICPSGIERDLTLVNKFASEYADLYAGSEERVLAARKTRSVFRGFAMQKWRTWNNKRGREKLQLTKFQKKEQDRSLIIVLVLLSYALQMELYFAKYSTNHIREILQLTQNQTQRILSQMVSRGLLIREKINRQCYYQLNTTSRMVQELLYSIGRIPTEDENLPELVNNFDHINTRTINLIAALEAINHSQQIKQNSFWLDWSPPRNLLRILNCIIEHLEIYKQYFS